LSAEAFPTPPASGRAWTLVPANSPATASTALSAPDRYRRVVLVVDGGRADDAGVHHSAARSGQERSDPQRPRRGDRVGLYVDAGEAERGDLLGHNIGVSWRAQADEDVAAVYQLGQALYGEEVGILGALLGGCAASGGAPQHGGADAACLGRDGGAHAAGMQHAHDDGHGLGSSQRSRLPNQRVVVSRVRWHSAHGQ
jgi:hypothetical protein